MKKILAAMVLCAMLVSSVVIATGAGSEEGNGAVSGASNRGSFGFALVEEIYNGGNVVLSPVSVEAALSMAADGAKDETLTEMLAAMNINSTDEILAAMPEDIHLANAVFTSDNAPLYQEYVNRLNDAYGAEWFKIDQHTVENANNWVNKHTDGLIETILSEQPDASTGLMLMNAVAMDADWQKPFMENAVEREMFHTNDGVVEVDMMYQTEFFSYAKKNGVQIVRLPYAESNMSMYVMLPREGKMEELLATLAEEGSAFFMEGLERREVDLALPKMDVSDDNSLFDALKALGIEAAFGPDANFAGMSEVPMYISEIFQKARIQVDESGTKAAASTVIAMPMMGMPYSEDGPVVMHADHPFAFAVVDEAAGAVCFAGAIENPLAA